MRYATGSMVGIALLIFVVGITVSGSHTSEAQDNYQQQIDDLATQVAGLEKRVSELESNSGVEQHPNPSDSADTAPITISGNGGVVSDDFNLSQGRYKVSATVQVSGFDGFALYIYTPSGADELLLNELIDESGTWTGSVIFDAQEGGAYFVEAQNTQSPWSLEFEPR